MAEPIPNPDEFRLPDPFNDIPLFSGVARRRLPSVTDAIAYFDPGETIIATGDAPRFITVILSGEVRVRRGGVHLVTRKRTDVLGEQAFVNGVVHSADCVAATPVKALRIPGDAVRTLLDDPAFVRNLLSDLSNKLRASTEERYQRFGSEQLLFSEFRSHVARPVRDALLGEGLEYGRPQRIDATILISDIRGFTGISESMDPIVLADDLSRYFSDAVDLIHGRGGFVDKFIGDAIMAFWGYPGTPIVDADTILACAEALVHLARRRTLGGKPIAIGVGISHGRVFMGNVGSNEKRQFTVLGSAVNLAARYQSACRDLGRDFVAGESFALRLTPERRSALIPSFGVPFKGAGTHDVFGLNIGGTQ